MISKVRSKAGMNHARVLVLDTSHSLVLFEFDTSTNLSKSSSFSNAIRQKQIFRDAEILPARTLCHKRRKEWL